MGLTGKNNEEKAWNFLKGKIPNDFGVAGLMDRPVRMAMLAFQFRPSGSNTGEHAVPTCPR